MKIGALAVRLFAVTVIALLVIAAAASSPLRAAPVAPAPQAPGTAAGDGPILQSSTLGFAPGSAMIGPGGSTVVQIQLDAVADLYGYQFLVTYDAGTVSAAGAFVNSFFDTTTETSVPSAWNAVCAAGVCRFAASKTSPGVAVSGSGVLAQITFTGLSEGVSALTFGDDLLSDRDGQAIAHSSLAGRITVCSGPALLQMTPPAGKIAIGASTTITVEALCMPDVYGYQFEVNDDPASLGATGAFVDTFFDTTDQASVPSGWDAACSSGVCRFAASKTRPAPPVGGSGPLATITYAGLHAGIVPLTFSADLFGDSDGMPIAHISAGAVITVYGYATLQGTVSLQGRLTPVTVGSVTFTETTGVYAPVTVPFSADTGAYTALVPVDPPGMTYQSLAGHSLYLSNLHAGLPVQPEQSYSLPATSLWAGDANNDGLVNVQDLSCIGGDYGLTPGTCGGQGGSDINADSLVNVQDLAVTGGNYGRRSPQPW